MNVAIVDNVRQYLGLPPSPLSPRYHRWPPGTHWTLLVVRPGAHLDSLEDTNTVTQLPQTGHEIVPHIATSYLHCGQGKKRATYPHRVYDADHLMLMLLLTLMSLYGAT